MIEPLLKYFSAIFFLTILSAGCNDKSTPPPPGDTDPGILRTDEFGNILAGDSTDWCFINSPNPSFGPSYPNPCVGPVFTISYSSPINDTIKIYFLKPNNDSIVVFNGAVLPGSNQFNVNVSGYSFTNTYQRLYLQSGNFTSSDSCKNYGDIRFEP